MFETRIDKIEHLFYTYHKIWKDIAGWSMNTFGSDRK